MMRYGRHAAVLLLAVLFGSCSGSADPEDPASTTPTLGPHDETATVRLDLMRVAPSVAEAGSELEVFFPEETPRGIHFVLEVQNEDSWNVRYHLISDWGGSEEPVVYETTDTVAYPDVGIGGPGPDTVLIPETAEPGEYRICTGNARPNFCALLRIDS